MTDWYILMMELFSRVFKEAHNMTPLCDVVNVTGGTPQFRIIEDLRPTAPVYFFYSQADLEDDLKGFASSCEVRKQIQTSDAVVTALAGDVVFSLISGTAAIVGPGHEGYLLTQNYAVLDPSPALDPRYLVYVLNEGRTVKHQLHRGKQGSITMKYTLKQLKDLNLSELPSKERQALVGEVYLDQLKLKALKQHVIDLEATLALETLRKVARL